MDNAIRGPMRDNYRPPGVGAKDLHARVVVKGTLMEVRVHRMHTTWVNVGTYFVSKIK